MLVLHLSFTPLAGAPIRICQALRLKGVEARCAVLSADIGDYANRAFDQDLVWMRDRDEIIDIARRCDVLHLHNYLSLGSQEFAPLDFGEFWKQGRPIVRQFHSAPAFVAHFCKTSVHDVLSCPIPKLVIGQFHERYYPDARLVPNIALSPEGVVASSATELPMRVGYAPSRFNSARSSRWDTKGYPETIRVLKHFCRSARKAGVRVEIDVIEQVSHRECLARKARCHIMIDDLVTGSYHLNTLESLAEGSASLTFMDRRTLHAVSELTSRNDFPAINVGLEDAHDVLLDLVLKPDIVVQIGQRSRNWMATHWAPASMAGHFLDAYAAVQRAPHMPFPKRFECDATTDWLAIGLHDVLWRNRTGRWPAITPDWILALRGVAGRALRATRLRQ